MSIETLEPEILGLSEAMNLRYQSQSCASCRYYRQHATGGVTSECLLLGRTLGIVTRESVHLLSGWAREKVCDGWQERPKKWEIYSDGVDSNPHWVDPYLPREVLNRLRAKLAKRLKLNIRWRRQLTKSVSSTSVDEFYKERG